MSSYGDIELSIEKFGNAVKKLKQEIAVAGVDWNDEKQKKLVYLINGVAEDSKAVFSASHSLLNDIKSFQSVCKS